MSANLPIVTLQWDDDVNTVFDLPKDLTAEDTGKAWWIDNSIHAWDGEDYRVRAMEPMIEHGIGPTGNFTIYGDDGYIELIEPDGTSTTN
jgi:hypothetical protein